MSFPFLTSTPSRVNTLYLSRDDKSCFKGVLRPVVCPLGCYEAGRDLGRSAQLPEGSGFLFPGREVGTESLAFAHVPVQDESISTGVLSAGFLGGCSTLPHL